MDPDQLSQLFGNMSMQDVLKALKDSQLLMQNLQEENRRLKTAAPPTTSLPSGTTSSEPTSFISQSSDSCDIGTMDVFANNPASKENPKSLLDSKDSQKELQYGAMKMVMFGHIWWERKHLFGVQHDLAIHELNAATLTNAIDTGITKPSPEWIVQLQLVLLLYKHLPAAYHLLVGRTIMGEYHKLEKIMKKAATDNRSNLINRLKHVAATIFEDIVPAGHFRKDFDQSTDPLCQCLMGYKPEKDEYTRLPPCLFSNGFTTGTTMFRTLVGVKILNCLLWGESALDAPNMSTKRTNGNLWHIKEVNTSALAFVGVMTCWMLSGDTKFASPGNKTGIDYIVDFDHYVARIDELVRKGTQSITDTFQFYNDHVFTPSRTLQSVVPTRVPVSASEEEEAIWKSLEELDEPDPESEIASIASTPPISSHEATVSPPNEPPATNNSSVTINTSPGPAGTDVDIGKASRSKKKGKKVVKTTPTVPSRVTRSRRGQAHGVAESSSTDAATDLASKRKGQAKKAGVAAQPSISPINVPADTATPTTTHAITPGVHFANSVNDGENENQDDEDDEDDEEEEEDEESE
ncbi:hypothetical protein IW261DRAFT_1422040 [Armillaria novae-zelandiae]|uniref:Uncharacterized protein n=1 Tax=Armillaria novae-zelandiae TaxID=153914 RepID=A0AA39U712_9AGAR|nr:hypothetical protein IW261DRAFT_1422040 [Armillaria novae-zelandiae]